MEDVLYQYARPYDPLAPLLCDDERPWQWLGDVLVPLPMKPGRPQRYEHAYERHGTCGVFLAFEPHTGFRSVQVRDRRTAAEYAQCLQNLLHLHYPMVDHIRLVQDNLHTHTPGSFYQVLPPEEALQCAQLCELHETPQKGRGLHRAAIEFGALATPCLDRRIPDRETLEKEALAWAHKRNKARKTVHWTFTKNAAREKLKNKYPMLEN